MVCLCDTSTPCPFVTFEAGVTVSDALKQMIAGERVEIERQKQYLLKKESEKQAASADYERDMARYKAALERVKKNNEK